jgi:hypothetical protein
MVFQRTVWHAHLDVCNALAHIIVQVVEEIEKEQLANVHLKNMMMESLKIARYAIFSVPVVFIQVAIVSHA